MYFNVEKFADCFEDMKTLFEKHWEEVALNKNKIKLNPDYDKYLAMEELGMISLITVRNNNEIVGYSIDILSPHLHYKDHIFALNDVIFLSPEYRAGRTALKLLLHVQEHLKSLGTSVHVLHMKTAHKFTGLAKMAGYNNSEETWSIFLGD